MARTSSYRPANVATPHTPLRSARTKRTGAERREAAVGCAALIAIAGFINSLVALALALVVLL